MAAGTYIGTRLSVQPPPPDKPEVPLAGCDTTWVSHSPLSQLVTGAHGLVWAGEVEGHKASSQVVHVAAVITAKEKLNSGGLRCLQGVH